MQLDKAIQERKSVKRFKEKKPDWRDIIECIDSARYAPMAGNIFSMRFILIEDKDVIQKIADAAQQDFVAQAKYVVVACSRPKQTVNAYGSQGKIYCRQQAGAAIQNFLLSIEQKGLATCWVGHFVERMIKQALQIPGDIDVEAVFPIGYQLDKKFTKKTKTDLDRALFFHKYGNKRKREPVNIKA